MSLPGAGDWTRPGVATSNRLGRLAAGKGGIPQDAKGQKGTGNRAGCLLQELQSKAGAGAFQPENTLFSTSPVFHPHSQHLILHIFT